MNENPCSNHEIHVLFEHGFNLTILKISPDLFVRHQTKSVAARTDHYVDVFVHQKCCTHYDVVMILESLTPTQFCLEKNSVR